MSRMRVHGLGAAALVLCLLVASCAPAVRVYVNPEADLAFYKKIAVMPFTDLSSSSLAAQRVTRSLVTELIMTNRFEILQPEDFTSALHRAGVFKQQDGTYDADKLKNAATQMGVNGLLRGAVTEYQMSRVTGGDIPTVAFDAELVDMATGTVVWRSSIAKRGKGRFSVFGNGTRSLGRLTQEACSEMVGRLKGTAL